MQSKMNSTRPKLPLSLVTAIVCTCVFFALLYTERTRPPSSSSNFKFTSCPRTDRVAKSRQAKSGWAEENNINSVADDRFEFDPTECSVVKGKWVYNSSIKPFYTDRSCPYLDRQVSCVKNGRQDFGYQHWEWQLDDCILPRFNPELALQNIQGKRLMFVGDSLQRGQWQSFVCLVESIIPKDQKSMKRGRIHSIFSAKEYNATIEFYWAPFLVESNSDVHIIGDPKKRIIKLDSIARHSEHWIGVDILVFNTYVWWMSGLKINSLWGSFANGEEGSEELEAPVAYRIGLKTWANWVDSTIDPNRTRVFFTTMSPTHMRSADWGHKDGMKCFNETKPITKKGHWGSGSDKRIMQVVEELGTKMKVPVRFINITQLSEHRVDAHSSIYTETQGKLLTEEQKANPLHYADCIHWCLPGVPDTWNQVLLAYL